MWPASAEMSGEACARSTSCVEGKPWRPRRVEMLCALPRFRSGEAMCVARTHALLFSFFFVHMIAIASFFFEFASTLY